MRTAAPFTKLGRKTRASRRFSPNRPLGPCANASDMASSLSLTLFVEQELEKAKQEKEEMQQTIQQRNPPTRLVDTFGLADIDRLGELNRTLQRSNESLEKEQSNMKEDVKGAEQSLAELRAEVDNIKKQASKFEAESRE
eukprot:1118231-Rhodomonas_salina.1